MIDREAFAPAPRPEGQLSAEVAGAGPAPLFTPEQFAALSRANQRRVTNLLAMLAQCTRPDRVARLGAEIREVIAGAKARRKPAGNTAPYTTSAAQAWARSQGWRLTQREAYDARTRRHRDLAGGSDVGAIDQDGRRVWIQGAGVGERAEHRRRFEARQGQLALGERFVYVEFRRGEKAPALVEWWR